MAMSEAKAPIRNVSITVSIVLLYVPIVMNAPAIIPTSRAMKIVPAPTPLLVGADKSAVQAKRVGEETPVAIPNTTDPIVY